MDVDGSLPGDAFPSLLAEYDVALAAGLPPPDALEAAVTRDLRDRLDRARSCLERLESVRRGNAPLITQTGAANETPSTTAGPGQIGRFRLLRLLGTGGFGLVYLAEDPVLGRQVALKVPRPEVLVNPGLRERFLREARAVARLSHGHIVPVFDSGAEGAFCYLVAAYCAGGTLADWLRRQTAPVPVRAAARLVVDLAGAVQHAHERGVLHRDLKPSNVLLEPRDAAANGTTEVLDFGARISDFGLAKFLDPAEMPAPDHPARTQTLTVMGTPAYMAPEQAEGRAADIGPATDVYGLGTILYELLTGRPPFAGAAALETVRRVVQDDAPSARRARPDVPRDLDAICLKCLAKAPADRYATAADLAADLESFLAGRATRARPANAWSRAVRVCRRHPAVAVLVAVVGLGLMGLAGGGAWYKSQVGAYETALAATAEQQRASTAAALADRERSDRLQAYAAGVRVAATQLAAGKNAHALDTLAAHSPGSDGEDQRGFEWHYLERQATSLRILRTSRQWVSALAFSPDGRTLTASCYDVLQRWDLECGRLLGRSEAFPPHALEGARLATDGSRGVTLAPGEIKDIVLWDTVALRPLRRRTPPHREFYQAAISPDGQTVALGGAWEDTASKVAKDMAVVRLWDISSGRERVLWQCHDPYANVTALRFAPDGRSLAVAYRAGGLAIDLLDLPGGQVRATLRGHGGFIFAVAFSPDGTLAASADSGADGTVKIWDATTGRERSTFALGQRVKALAFSPDGRRLAVGTWPFTDPNDQAWSVSLWDVASGMRLAPELRLGCGVLALAYSPNGHTLAVCGGDEVIRLWEPEPPPAFVSLPGHQPREAWAVAFLPDGETLVSAGDDHAVRLWDVVGRRQQAVYEGHESLASCVAISPDGKRVVSGSYDKTVRVWDRATGKVAWIGRHEGHVRGVAYSPDGRLVASSGRDRCVRVWDAATGAERATLTGHTSPHINVAFGGRQLLASCSEESYVRLWDLGPGQAHRVLQTEDDIFSVAFSPDGMTMALGTRTGPVQLFEVEGGRKLRVLKSNGKAVAADGKPTGSIRALAFSPDGKTLASTGEDKAVRLWQVATGQELLSFPDQPHFVKGLAFSADSRNLAAALHDGSLWIWPAAATR